MLRNNCNNRPQKAVVLISQQKVLLSLLLGIAIAWFSTSTNAISLFRENRSNALHQALRRNDSTFAKSIENANQIHKQLEGQYQMSHCFQVERIVAKIISKIPSYSGRGWKVHLIEGDDVNAFCTGGDRVYLFQGLLDKAPDEDALAFVMAHEIGHSIAGHAERGKMLRGQNKLAMILLGKLAGGVNDGMSAAYQFIEGRYSRDHEREADILGAWYSYKAGYDPIGGVRFFEKLMEMHGDSNILGKLFGSHPALKERMARIEQVGRFTRREIDYLDLGQELKYTLRVLEDSSVYPYMWQKNVEGP